ncbi:MAG: hypothetical protein PHW72_00730 [Candidatus Pacebacteria bacterium]|nr:hypothetical protein [Candidatus Paceibacterota bacterium]
MKKAKFAFLLIVALILIVMGAGGVGAPIGGPPGGNPGSEVTPPLVSQVAPARTTSYEGWRTLPATIDLYYGYHYSGYVKDINKESKSFTYSTGALQPVISIDATTVFFYREGKHNRRVEFSSDQFFDALSPGELLWIRGIDTQKKIFQVQVPTDFFSRNMKN